MNRILISLAAMTVTTGAYAQGMATLTDTPVLEHAVVKGKLVSPNNFAAQNTNGMFTFASMAPQTKSGPVANNRMPLGMLSPIAATSNAAGTQLVKRGQNVTIQIAYGPYSITTEGRALSSGAVGESVRVVSTSTGRTLQAVVSEVGQVRITGQYGQ